MHYLKNKLLLSLTDLTQKTSVKGLYKFVKESEYWNAEKINDYQIGSLRKLIVHAYENVPFYRRFMNENDIIPTDIQALGDLRLFPILRREEVIANRESLIATNYTIFKPQMRSTGGTTGIPMKYMSDLQSWSLGWALKYRAWETAGYSLGTKIGLLAGASLIPNHTLNLNRKIWNKLNGFIPLSMTHSTSEILNSYAIEIQKEKIEFLRGYPSSIFIFAKHCLQNRISIKLKAVITTAEVLQPIYRETIESAFECAVFDTYGCADAGANANECPMHNGLHVSFEPSILELVPTGVNTSEKEIIVTNLTNYAMPMIRYSPGDLAEENNFDCSCGRSTKLLEKVIGRTTDIISFENGRTIAGPALTLIFRQFDIIQYQVAKIGSLRLEIRIKSTESFDEYQNNKLIEILQYHCGQDVRITVIQVDEFAISNSGKHKFIVSEDN